MISCDGHGAIMDLTASFIVVLGVIISSSINLLGGVDGLSSLSLLSSLLPDALETELQWPDVTIFASLVPQYPHYKIQIHIACAGLSFRFNCFSKPGNMLLSTFDRCYSLAKRFRFFLFFFKGSNTATSSGYKAWKQFGRKHTILILFSIALSKVSKVK